MQQIIVEKQHVDVFTVPNLAQVIERLDADTFVVYGRGHRNLRPLTRPAAC